MLNRKYISLVLLLPILWVLIACERVIELDYPPHTPKLVVNGLINPDSALAIELSASQNAFSNQEHELVENATVKVFKNGIHFLNLEHTGKGIYRSDIKPEAGHRYELQATAPGYPAIKATTYIPVPAALHEVHPTVGPPSSSGSTREPTTNVSFVLSDPAAEENFYLMRFFTVDSSRFFKVAFLRDISLNESIPVAPEFWMGSSSFYSDRLFNGQALRFMFNLGNRPDRVTYITVGHISKDYYHYMRTVGKQSQGDNTNIQPVQVSNNIEGGIGLFAGYNSFTLELK